MDATERRNARLADHRAAVERVIAEALEPVLGDVGDAAGTASYIAERLLDAGVAQPAELNDEEAEAMDLLVSFMGRLHGWGLRSNEDELISAIHTLQGFVIQHALKRLAPGAWGTWYSTQAKATDLEESEANASGGGA